MRNQIIVGLFEFFKGDSKPRFALDMNDNLVELYDHIEAEFKKIASYIPPNKSISISYTDLDESGNGYLIVAIRSLSNYGWDYSSYKVEYTSTDIQTLIESFDKAINNLQDQLHSIDDGYGLNCCD